MWSDSFVAGELGISRLSSRIDHRIQLKNFISERDLPKEHPLTHNHHIFKNTILSNPIYYPNHERLPSLLTAILNQYMKTAKLYVRYINKRLYLEICKQQQLIPYGFSINNSLELGNIDSRSRSAWFHHRRRAVTGFVKIARTAISRRLSNLIFRLSNLWDQLYPFIKYNPAISDYLISLNFEVLSLNITENITLVRKLIKHGAKWNKTQQKQAPFIRCRRQLYINDEGFITNIRNLTYKHHGWKHNNFMAINHTTVNSNDTLLLCASSSDNEEEDDDLKMDVDPIYNKLHTTSQSTTNTSNYSLNTLLSHRSHPINHLKPYIANNNFFIERILMDPKEARAAIHTAFRQVEQKYDHSKSNQYIEYNMIKPMETDTLKSMPPSPTIGTQPPTNRYNINLIHNQLIDYNFQRLSESYGGTQAWTSYNEETLPPEHDPYDPYELIIYNDEDSIRDITVFDNEFNLSILDDFKNDRIKLFHLFPTQFHPTSWNWKFHNSMFYPLSTRLHNAGNLLLYHILSIDYILSNNHHQQTLNAYNIASSASLSVVYSILNFVEDAETTHILSSHFNITIGNIIHDLIRDNTIEMDSTDLCNAITKTNTDDDRMRNDSCDYINVIHKKTSKLNTSITDIMETHSDDDIMILRSLEYIDSFCF